MATATQSNKGDRIIGFFFAGSYYGADTWKELLLTLCCIISDQHGPRFYERAKQLHGSKLMYFSRSPTGMREPRRIGDTNIFVETKWDADTIEKHCRRLMAHFGYPDSDLKIETDSNRHEKSDKLRFETHTRIGIKPNHNSSHDYGEMTPTSQAVLKEGDLVIHPKRPQWGYGKVIASSGKYAEVLFSRKGGKKTFLREDNSLIKAVDVSPQDERLLSKLERQYSDPSGLPGPFEEPGVQKDTTAKAVSRDQQNAYDAKKMAELDLKNVSIRIEKPDITRGTSKSHLASLQDSQRYINTLVAVASHPFHAMVEVETESRGRDGRSLAKRQLWYANENANYNLPLDRDGKKVNVLSWTHPGVQLALVEPLGEEHDIAAFGYNLTGVTPLARAKFWELFPDIAGIYEPGGQVRGKRPIRSERGLKAVKLDMTREQVQAFISKMNGMMLVSGAPGSGKTTVAMQRIRFLYDQQELRKEDLNNVEYSPALTRIFLANQNLIDFSKDILSRDLDIPSDIVELVPRFMGNYLNEIWAYKHNAQPRRKQLFFYDERGRQAFFGLCNSKQLQACWTVYESQISERLAQADHASWAGISGQGTQQEPVGKRIRNWFKGSRNQSIDMDSEMLVKAMLSSSNKKKSSNPTRSSYTMDSLYAQVGQVYENLRNRHGDEGILDMFDIEFKKWLFWVYDPLDAIMTYFQDNFYEGGIRIKNGIAGKLSENDILGNIRTEWEERKYGDEQVPWLAFLLRFVLPISNNPRERFRDLPNPLMMGENTSNWTHVMIDEAQDLCVAEAALLSSFVHPEGALTVSADFHQVVSPVWGMENPEAFKIGSSLRDKGAFMTYPFAKNMRQSKQIGMFLQAFYQNIFGELAPFECNDTIEGPIPLLLLCSHSDFALRIKQRVAVLTRNSDIESIALLQIDEDQKAMEQMRNSLQQQGVELAPIWAASDDANRIITTSVERIKGLEYDVCFVVGMDNMENSALKHSKNRAYVALSRPARQLTMFCEEIPNSLQKISKDLLEILRV